jgi:phosphoglycerol transferase MdoB-like AlkP superfamily enzyme
MFDPGFKEDDYLTKVVKYIPSEIVFAYVSILGIINTMSELGEPKIWVWIVFWLLLVLTPIWILGGAKRGKLPLPWYQAVAGAVAFASWVFALGKPFSYLGWYRSAFGSIVLILVTLFIPAFENLFVKPTETQV